MQIREPPHRDCNPFSLRGSSDHHRHKGSRGQAGPETNSGDVQVADYYTRVAEMEAERYWSERGRGQIGGWRLSPTVR
jgi:hypothetical protein